MNGTALITGASSGIGFEMTRMLAGDGWNVIMVGRNTDALEQLRVHIGEKHSDVSAFVIESDLSKDGAAEKLYADVKEIGIPVDFLINCAGFGDFGFLSERDIKKQQDMIHVNDLALTTLTMLFLPEMISRGSGRILNVSSIAAFQPGPLMSVYYASKAYVQSISEALAVELKGTGVHVSVLCPGPTDTKFMDVAESGKQNMFKKSVCATAEQVARYGLKKAFKNKVVIVCGISSKLLIFAERLLPRRVVRWAVYRIQSKPAPGEKRAKRPSK